MPLVTITGISGYVGAQVCLHFLKDGNFKVRGTVRSVKNAAKIDPLKKAFKEYFGQLELVEADLMKEDSLIDAIEGSVYVVHTASPFPIASPKDENELIEPAVNGTLAVMKGCRRAKVKRCVITSSVAAIMDNNKSHFTEKDWSNLAISKPYPKSKHLAEKAAWDFLKELPKEEQFELVTVNPGFVIGPNLNEAQFSSGDVIKKFMLGEFPGVPKISLPMVDVRDVAKAHVQALKMPEAAGQRFILTEDTHSMSDLAKELSKDYSSLGYPIPTRDLPHFLISIASIFDSEAAEARDIWGLHQTFDNAPSKQVLGINYIPLSKSAPQMVKSMLKTGYLPDYKKDGAPVGMLMKVAVFLCTLLFAAVAINH